MGVKMNRRNGCCGWGCTLVPAAFFYSADFGKEGCLAFAWADKSAALHHWSGDTNFGEMLAKELNWFAGQEGMVVSGKYGLTA